MKEAMSRAMSKLCFIGTSPLYVLNGIWPATGPVPSTEDIIGGVSAIVWSISLLPLLKYVRDLSRRPHPHHKVKLTHLQVFITLRFATQEGTITLPQTFYER